MGQANSTTTKSDLTFGYVSVPPRRRKSKRTTTNSSDDLISSQSHYDLLISSPQLYALSASPTSISDGDTLLESSPSSSSTTNNTCSGTMTTNLDDDWEQLQHVKDVSYIDESYYDDQLFKSTRHELVHDDTCFNGYWWESQDLHSHKQKCMQKRRVRCMDVYRCMDRAMLHMDLCNRRFASITANIACFNSIKRLDLSYNELTFLPDEIEALCHLQYFNISHNHLTSLPNTLCNLTNLVELDVSYNRIEDLTPCLRRPDNKNLEILHACSNRIADLPAMISNLTCLATLNLSQNPLYVLPAEIARLTHLRRLLLRECPLIDPKEQQKLAYPLAHDPPSLIECCARLIIKQQLPIHENLPTHLRRYLGNPKSCSACRNPYFDSFVSRGQMIEKLDGLLPLEHRLCSAHWSDESDRVLAMFAIDQQPIPYNKNSHKAAVSSITSTPLSSSLSTMPTINSRQLPSSPPTSRTSTSKKLNQHRWSTRLSTLTHY